MTKKSLSFALFGMLALAALAASFPYIWSAQRSRVISRSAPSKHIAALPSSEASSSHGPPGQTRRRQEESPGPRETRSQPLTTVKVYGTVTDAGTGAAIEGAHIAADWSVPSEAEKGKAVVPDEAMADYTGAVFQCDTEDAGAFSLTLPAAGESRLSCVAAGYAKAYHTLPGTVYSDRRVDFHLQPGYTVSGRVTDLASGKGIEGIAVEVVDTARVSSKDWMLDRESREEDYVSEEIEEAGAATFAVRDDRGYIMAAATGADGSYIVEGLPAGSYLITLLARSKGYVFRPSDAVFADLGEHKPLAQADFQLVRGAVIQGLVRDEQGRPVEPDALRAVALQFVPDFRDSLSPDAAAFGFIQGATDKQGNYEIVGLDFDVEYQVWVDAQGFASARSAPFRVSNGESPITVNLTVTKGSLVSGVTRHADGRPARGVEIELWPERLSMSDFAGPRPVRADEDGRFRFTHVRAGTYILYGGPGVPYRWSARSHTYTIDEEDGIASRGLTIDVDGVRDVTGIELILESESERRASGEGAGTIEGVVLDGTGAPVQDVRVEARLSLAPDTSWGATTRNDGAFTLTELHGGSVDLYVACEAGVARETAVPVGSRITLRLQAPARMSGVILDRTGNPAPSCKVKLENEGDAAVENPFLEVFGGLFPTSRLQVASDVNGFFEFAPVEPGQYRVKAQGSQGNGESSVIVVNAGADITSLRIVLEPGARLSGTVRNDEGEPILGALIKLVDSNQSGLATLLGDILRVGTGQTSLIATTDGEGRFEIVNVPAADYTVAASHPDYARTIHRGVSLSKGRDITDFRIVMCRGGGVTGQYMVDGEAGPGVTVVLVGESGTHVAVTDQEGRFELSELTPGSYMVSVVDVGRFASEGPQAIVQQSLQVIDVEEGQDVEIDFSPPPGVAVSGRITGDLGPLTTVTLRRPEAAPAESIWPLNIAGAIEALRGQVRVAMADGQGQFQLSDIEPGVYTVDVLTMDIESTNPIALREMMNRDRMRHFRQQILVGERPVTLNLEMPSREE